MKHELEDRWRELGEFIREQRRLGHMSLRRLSELADVSNPYLSQIERGLRRPSAQILQQIARALQISAEQLYVRAGILDDRDLEAAADLLEAIRRDGVLSEDQKATLERIYRSFQAENLAESAAGVGDEPPSDESSDTSGSDTAVSDQSGDEEPDASASDESEADAGTSAGDAPGPNGSAPPAADATAGDPPATDEPAGGEAATEASPA